MGSVGTQGEILVPSKESQEQNVELWEEMEFLSCLEIVLESENAVLRKKKTQNNSVTGSTLELLSI